MNGMANGHEGMVGMSRSIEVRKGSANLTAREQAELESVAGRVRDRLRRTAADVIAIGEDLIRAKALLGHGGFGSWLDREFALSRRSAEQFMAAARRFGTKGEAISHLPAGVVLELSARSVPDELVEGVLAGEVQPSVSAIRAERAGGRSDDRAFRVGGTFINYLERFEGADEDFAAGVAAHVLRRWKEPEHREWFAQCMRLAAGMIEDNSDVRIPLLELPRTTVRGLKKQRAAERAFNS
jgi:hypothetical protein